MPRWIELQYPTIFQAAEIWREESLIQRRALFSDDQDIWVPARLDAIADRLDMPAEGRFLPRFEAQLVGADRATKQLAAELFWLIRLAPSNIGQDRKRRDVLQLLRSAEIDEPQRNKDLLSDQALRGIGSGGQGAVAYIAQDMAYGARCIAQLMRDADYPNLINDPAHIQRVITEAVGGDTRQFRHMLLCLLYPGRFERVFSRTDRETIARRFVAQGWINALPNYAPSTIDQALADIINEGIRRGEGSAEDLDFYQGDGANSQLASIWNPENVETDPADPSVEIDPRNSDFPLNLIFFGPPGTGKTYNTARAAVEICDGKSDLSREKLMDRYQNLCRSGQIVFVTFHQSFSYEDFVEGLRPQATKDGLIYDVQPGVLRKIASNATGGASERVANDQRGDFDFLYSKLIEEVKDCGSNGMPMRTMLGRDFCLKLNGTVLTAYITASTAPLYENHLEKKWANEANIRTPNDCNMQGSQGNPSYYFSVIEKLRQLREKFPRTSDLAPQPETPLEDDSKKSNYVLIIDEINRANISKVFGELITLLEPDKRLGAENELTVTLPYSSDKFGLPLNLYIIGTMNTADRSIALLDIALRRRFNFEEIAPNPKLLTNNVQGVDLQKLLEEINLRIEFLLDRDHRIGHAYFMGIKSIEDLNDVFRNRIIPLLQEYFYDDWKRIVQVLATGESDEKASSTFITEIPTPKIPGVDPDRLGNRYRVNAEKAFNDSDYQHIYNPKSNNASAAE